MLLMGIEGDRRHDIAVNKEENHKTEARGPHHRRGEMSGKEEGNNQNGGDIIENSE